MNKFFLLISVLCAIVACADESVELINHVQELEATVELVDSVNLDSMQYVDEFPADIQSMYSSTAIINIATFENSQYRASVTVKVRAMLLISGNYYNVAELTPYIEVSEGYATPTNNSLPLNTTLETNYCQAIDLGHSGAVYNFRLRYTGIIKCSRTLAAALGRPEIYVNVDNHEFSFQVSNLMGHDDNFVE